VRKIALLLGLMALLAAAWVFTPLKAWADPGRFLDWAIPLRSVPVAALLVPVIFVLLGLLMFPIMVLRLTTVLVFGPILGPIYALVGALASALVGHSLGRWLGADALERISGERTRAIMARLRHNGLLTIAALRLIPLGPFTLVNAAAGAARIRLRSFALGTVLGLIPGVVVMALFSHQLEQVLR
jgi:phospholipase D1/2